MFDVKVKVDLTDLKERVKQYPKAYREAAVSKMTEALMLLEREVTTITPYGAGPIHLRDTIHDKVDVAGNRITGILGTPLEYGEPVELGTKPHFPCISS